MYKINENVYKIVLQEYVFLLIMDLLLDSQNEKKGDIVDKLLLRTKKTV